MSSWFPSGKLIAEPTIYCSRVDIMSKGQERDSTDHNSIRINRAADVLKVYLAGLGVDWDSVHLDTKVGSTLVKSGMCRDRDNSARMQSVTHSEYK